MCGFSFGIVYRGDASDMKKGVSVWESKIEMGLERGYPLQQTTFIYNNGTFISLIKEKNRHEILSIPLRSNLE